MGITKYKTQLLFFLAAKPIISRGRVIIFWYHEIFYLTRIKEFLIIFVSHAHKYSQITADLEAGKGIKYVPSPKIVVIFKL